MGQILAVLRLVCAAQPTRGRALGSLSRLPYSHEMPHAILRQLSGDAAWRPARLRGRLWAEKKRPPGLYRGLAVSIVIALVLGAMLVVATWDADPDEPLPNVVYFHISCSDRSQPQFDHATSLL